MKNKIESAVIVDNEFGSTATLRFNDPSLDRILSGTKPNIYVAIEKYVKKVTDV